MLSVATVVANGGGCPTAAARQPRRAIPTLFSLLAFSAAVLASGPARAATLSFEGEFTLAIGTTDPVVLPGSGVATVNGSVGAPGGPVNSMLIPAGALRGTASLVIYNASPVSGIVLAGGTIALPPVHVSVGPASSLSLEFNAPTGSVSNASGSFSDNSLNGPMPINGVAVVCLFQPCSASPSANLKVPLTPVGQGGTVSTQGLVSITAVGAPWTTGTVTAVQMGVQTAMGFQHGPASAANTAAQASGQLQLVTPVQVSTSLGAFPQVAVFSFLNIHFAPEPGQFALAASAAVGLALVALGKRGRKRG